MTIWLNKEENLHILTDFLIVTGIGELWFIS